MATAERHRFFQPTTIIAPAPATPSAGPGRPATAIPSRSSASTPSGPPTTSSSRAHEAHATTILRHTVTDGALSGSSILLDENGDKVSLFLYAWTNTTPDGEIASATEHCGNWGASEFPNKGRRGLTAAMTSEWTDAESNSPAYCSKKSVLYCVEQ